MTIAEGYKKFEAEKSAFPYDAVPPMKTVAELEQRKFPFPLPSRITRIYDGSFYLPEPSSSERPYGFLVFATTFNGKVTFPEPKEIGAGPTDFYLYDQLAKTFADAVVAGAETIRGKPGQERITLSLYDPELVRLRMDVLQKPRHPLHVLITASGRIETKEEFIFNVPEFKVVVFTTDQGKANLEREKFGNEQVQVRSLGEHVDFKEMAKILRQEYGVERMLVIGGATIAAHCVDAGIIDEIFVTIANSLGGGDKKTFYEGSGVSHWRRLTVKLLPSEREDSLGPIMVRMRH